MERRKFWKSRGEAHGRQAYLVKSVPQISLGVISGEKDSSPLPGLGAQGHPCVCFFSVAFSSN